MIATAYAIGAVAGGLVGLGWRPRRPLLVAVGAVVGLSALVAGLALAAPLSVLAVAGLLGGLQASLHEVLWTTNLQQRVPAEARGGAPTAGWGALLFAPWATPWRSGGRLDRRGRHLVGRGGLDAGLYGAVLAVLTVHFL